MMELMEWSRAVNKMFLLFKEREKEHDSVMGLLLNNGLIEEEFERLKEKGVIGSGLN